MRKIRRQDGSEDEGTFDLKLLEIFIVALFALAGFAQVSGLESNMDQETWRYVLVMLFTVFGLALASIGMHLRDSVEKINWS
jgi:hypothetical protein